MCQSVPASLGHETGGLPIERVGGSEVVLQVLPAQLHHQPRPSAGASGITQDESRSHLPAPSTTRAANLEIRRSPIDAILVVMQPLSAPC